jgi:Zn finger protein HypA/HybF involved in hydrogenase expression
MEIAVHVLMVRLGMCVCAALRLLPPYVFVVCTGTTLPLRMLQCETVSSAVWCVMCQKVVHNLDLMHF